MQIDVLLPPAAKSSRKLDRVRNSTPPSVNYRIDDAMMKRIWVYARKTREEITNRIEELDREWDLERVLETNAAGLALTGVIMSAFSSRKWLLLPAAVLGSLLQHSLTRRSAPVHLLRRFGVRTRREIEAEKYAMRLLRGDFDSLKDVADETHRAIEALRLSRP
jgi:hypothetical protein